MMVAFSQTFLGFKLSKGHTFSLLQPGQAQSATYFGFLLLTLKGLFHLPSLLIHIYAKKKPLHTEADFESVSG